LSEHDPQSGPDKDESWNIEVMFLNQKQINPEREEYRYMGENLRNIIEVMRYQHEVDIGYRSYEYPSEK
jgi:hypothetical protein